MAQLTIPILTPDMAGCWFDCARGRYIGVAVIEEAQAFGWDGGGYSTEDFDADAEFYCEAWDAAEQYLNGLAPEGYWIGTTEWGGDFGMWEVEPEEEESCVCRCCGCYPCHVNEQPIGCDHAFCDVDSLPTLTREEG